MSIDANQPSSKSFTRAFIPGLVVGLIVGGFAGAFIPPLLQTVGGPSPRPVGSGSKTTVRDEPRENRTGESTPNPETDPATPPSDPQTPPNDPAPATPPADKPNG